MTGPGTNRPILVQQLAAFKAKMSHFLALRMGPFELRYIVPPNPLVFHVAPGNRHNKSKWQYE